MKAKDVDSYIAKSRKEAKPKLKEIRKIIRSTVPKVEEKIGYGMPFYKYYGSLAGFAEFKNHVSYFGTSSLTQKDRKNLEKKGYKTSKGTIQIQFDQKVPAAEIKRVLKAKAKHNEEKRK